ncbi:MAG: hypothetical protein IPK83_20260 [Planctomycetes bacterium]|nr:hypothetical protein [Planctomycetota bacterium]
MNLTCAPCRTDPGVLTQTLGDTPVAGLYFHLGDPDVYRYQNTDYLVVPMESGFLPGAIAVFRCSDLSYVLYAELTEQAGDAGWCAISRDGKLFSSLQHASTLLVYDMDWSCVNAPCEAFVTFQEEIPLKDEQGNPLPDLVTTQGGKFAPDGTLLYLTSGFFDDNEALQASEGITVMDTASWWRVAHSTNGYGQFNYYYNPGCCTYGEPEGLVVWDLDNGRAPGMSGQLHVFRTNNDPIGTDSVTFFHYTNVIRVTPGTDCNLSNCCPNFQLPGCPTLPNSVPCAIGGSTCPMQIFAEALDYAWSGAEIRLRAATYTGTMTISKRVRLTSDGGVARLGG